MGAHSDNEKELGTNPCIASVSLGAERTLVFKHRKLNTKTKISLSPGSLMIMKNETQSFWKHEVPKSRKPLEPRINLTFRRIIF